jgi:hypothetical protein
MRRVDDATRLAVVALIEKAEEAGIGIALVPEDDGWRVVHVGLNWPAVSDTEEYTGELSSAYTLEDAARGAMCPLVKLSEDWEHFLESRGERGRP